MMQIDAIKLTQELIRIESINPPGNEAACAHHVAKLLRQGGFITEMHSFGTNRVSVVAKRGGCVSGTDIPICFSGHLDTVPLGAAKWSVDPFSAEIIKGRLYGRGASDMKSGVAAMIAAAIEAGPLLDSGPGLMLVLTGGEETGCEGARHLIEQDPCLGKVGAMIIAEPTGNLPRIGHKGALWLIAKCHGKAAHGAMPDLGINAIYQGAEVVRKLQEFGFNTKRHNGLGAPTLNVGRIAGGRNINSVPDLAEISIDIRTIPNMCHTAISENLQRHLAPELDELSIALDLDGVWTEPNDPWIAQATDWIAPETLAHDMGGVPFFTDASVLKAAFGNPPTLIIGPGEIEMAHQTDEYCLTHRIPEAVSIYRRLLLDWQNKAFVEN